MGARGKSGDGGGEAQSGPLRLCALSRLSMPPDELIRFVAAPDGTIIADLARRLPGRGVWVSATREAIAAAVRKEVFARSLKRRVSAGADLPAQVERLLVKRLTEAVSIAKKAGLLVAGFYKVEEQLDRGQVAVLLHAAEAASAGAAALDRKFRALLGGGDPTPLIVCELTGAELSLAMGRPNVVHAAAAEGGASQRLVAQARRLRRYRRGEAPNGHKPAPIEPDRGQANTGRA
jgi:predicted RNA-binding protein YlxR (DUF448 family)